MRISHLTNDRNVNFSSGQNVRSNLVFEKRDFSHAICDFVMILMCFWFLSFVRSFARSFASLMAWLFSSSIKFRAEQVDNRKNGISVCFFNRALGQRKESTSST